MGRGSSRTRSPHCAHAFPRAEGARSRSRGGVGRSSRQALAALETTGLQDGAAATGGHARAEAVLHRPALFVGLIRTLHENSSDLNATRRQNARSRRIFGHQLVCPGNEATPQATGVIGVRATHRGQNGSRLNRTGEVPLEIHYPQPATVVSPAEVPLSQGSGVGGKQQVMGSFGSPSTVHKLWTGLWMKSPFQ